MTVNDNAVAMAFGILKANVGLLNPPREVEDFMINCLHAADAELRRANVRINAENADDLHLLAMYAAWLYRNRVTGAAKPEMLRSAMRNRQVGSATEVDE